MPFLRILRGCLLLIFISTFAFSAISLRGLSQHVGGGSYGSGSSGGNCSNVGQAYSDNPFTGWPIPSANWAFITATYCDPAYMINFGTIHWGVDFGYPYGTPALATAFATVERSEYNHPLRGHNVKLCAINGWCATYMHLSQIDVFTGDSVYLTQQIGLVGSTGNSTGSHLHYELHDPAGTPVDPEPTFP
jgi:murein DD-endopeptidase MepM/ murein hydrolase activator NlpD